MNNKKYKWIKEVVLVLLVLVVASGVFLAISGKTGLVGDGAGIALQSWNQLFGGGSVGQVALDDSVDLSDSSSSAMTASSSDRDDLNTGGGSLNQPVSQETSQKTNATDILGMASQNSDSDSDGGLGSTVADEGTTVSNDGSSSTTSADNMTTSKAEIAAPQATAQTTASSTCSFPSILASSSRKASDAIVLNEIAWMGTLPEDGETAAKASEREWIELKNRSDYAVNISNWHILDSAGNLKIALADGTNIPPLGFYLLVRGGQATIDLPADGGYSGSLPNTGDQLALLDADCGLSDFLDASASAGGWPGGNNTTKQTLERDASGDGWHTSAQPDGTPRRENSVPAVLEPSSSAVGLQNVSNSQATDNSQSVNNNSVSVSVSSQSNIASSDGLAPSSDNTTSPAPVSTSQSTSSSATSSPLTQSQAQNSPSATAASSGGINHPVIAAVQIAGASSSNDLVKIFNPTAGAVDLSGWKLHKKSSTGTDYSLRTFGAGSTIAPGGYFVWANSTGGFSDSIGADASSAETLSADNSVALFDASSTVVDQVAWGTGTNQYAEGTAYPTDPTANQVLARKTENGMMVDTDDNAQDFEIQ